MQLALSEMSDGAFVTYLIALTISGVLLLVMAIGGFFNETRGTRIISGVVGVVFLGYAVYLAFVFTAGAVWMPLYVFIVPALLMGNIIRRRRERALEDARTNHAAEATGWGITPGTAAAPVPPPAQPGPPAPTTEQHPSA